jgi:voltage-gated potassium channel
VQSSDRKKNGWQNLILLASVIITPVFLFAGLIHYFESGQAAARIKSFWDAVWWTVVTMSTVGYGDLTPVSNEGKVLAVVAIITGIILIAVLTATIASKLVERLVIKVKGKDTSKLGNHILILGWNENGEKIVGNIERECESDTDIVVMCSSEHETILPDKVIKVTGNITKLEELRKVSAHQAKIAIVLADSKAGTDTDSKTILTVMAVKRISEGKTRCICEVFSSEDREYLENAGADEIIVRSELAGTILSRTVYNPGLGGFMQDLLKFEGTSTILMKLAIPEQVGMAFGQLFSHLYQKHNEILLGILRNGTVLTNPDSDEIIKENDKLFMLSPELACTMKGR